ncbi:MAG: ion transporter [Ectothiorhodospiraceae bacterium]|nr:ion transporter [Ectothiorhodospiraceae bacterium]
MEYIGQSDLRQRIGEWVERPRIQAWIVAIIMINAVTLGLETSPLVMQHAGLLVLTVERVILAIFVVELGLKLYAFGPRFFREPWNVFDFIIVSIALIPASGPFAILRALRILRVLRLLTKIRRLREITESLLKAIPSIGWIAALLLLVFYVFAVMGTKLFGASFDEDFGHLGRAMYSLFQVMTLESWSQEIARPIMAEYPFAWIYFITFILVTAFTVLNLFIGIIVSTMQERHYELEDAKRAETEARAHAEREEMLLLLRELRDRVERIERVHYGRREGG